MIADKIKNARTIKKLTREQVAEDLNVSRQTISNWENGKSLPGNLHRNRLLKISMFPGRLFLTGKMEFPIVKDTTPNITNSRLNNIP